MQTITQSFGLLWNALFLDDQAYATMRDNKNPVRKGLVILIILGLAIALAGIIGTTLEWASGPSMDAIRETVWELYQQSPWWQFMEVEPEALEMFTQVWDQMWQIMGYVIPTPVSSLSALIFKPLGLIIAWLIFGLLAHLFARMLGGSANLGQTLGATSLAAAPQLLLLLTVLPFVVVAGITTWTLLCRYMAIRVTHDLSWARAMWVVLLPNIVLFVIVFLLALMGGVIAGSLIAGGF
jgi:hypothetical protein